MIRPGSLPSLLWVPILLHLAWGILLLVSESPMQTIAIAGITKYLHLNALGLALVCLTASACAIYAIRLPFPWTIAALIPQQFLLLLSAFSAIEFILRGVTVDGTTRPWAFLAAAQSPTIILALYHLYVLCTKQTISRDM